ncbi:MAG: hypothetical protein WCP97_04115 [bacterium]
MKIAYVSTWLPTFCGIANFTQDLSAAVEQYGGVEWEVVELQLQSLTKLYNPKIRFTVDARKKEEFVKAAFDLNASDVDVVSVQHEFRLFRKDRDFRFFSLVEKPIVLNLHTVLNPKSRCWGKNFLKLVKQTKEIASYCEKVVVMNSSAKKYATEFIGIPTEKIEVIPHGAHQFLPTIKRSALLKQYQLPENAVIYGATGIWGGKSRFKGLQRVIDAFEQV